MPANETIDRLGERAGQYGPRALELLEKIRTIMNEEGFTTDAPFDLSCDDYKWALPVWRNADKTQDEMIDIAVEMPVAYDYGEEHSFDGHGMSFGISIVEWGGLILGGFQPFNYTDLCWVDGRDDEAVERRWKMIEDADLSQIPALCAKKQ